MNNIWKFRIIQKISNEKKLDNGVISKIKSI